MLRQCVTAKVRGLSSTSPATREAYATVTVLYFLNRDRDTDELHEIFLPKVKRESRRPICRPAASFAHPYPS